MKPLTDQETTKAWRELKRKSWSSQPSWPLVEAGYVSFDTEECWTITAAGLAALERLLPCKPVGGSSMTCFMGTNCCQKHRRAALFPFVEDEESLARKSLILSQPRLTEG